MALNPVGNVVTIATSGTSAMSGAQAHKADTLRLVAKGADAHVAIGTNPTAAVTNFYIPEGGTASLSVGRPSSQRVVGVTTGTTTKYDFPQGTGSPFVQGDAVTLSVTGAQSYYDFSHKIVQSVNTTSSVDGYFSTRIIVDTDTSGIATAFSAQAAELRGSFKIAVRTASGTGSLYAQQVQITGDA